MNRVFGDRKTILILLIPPLAIYVLLKVVPVLWSLGLSFFQGNTLRGFEFVGIQNFTTFFTDGAALQSLWVSVSFAAMATIGQVTLGYLLALLYVFVLRKGSAFVRTAVFFPMVLPTVAVALLFRSLVSVGENQGPVNDVINFFGGDSVEFMASTAGTMAVAIIMTLWSSMGFYAVLLFTGLLDIPDEIIESARLDGASRWEEFRDVTLPGIRPTLIFMILMTTIWSFLTFDYIWILTQGGPAGASEVLAVLVYKEAFNNFNAGYASAIGLTMSFFVGCVIAIFLVLRRRGWEI